MQILINTEAIEVNASNVSNLSQLIRLLETTTLEPKNTFITSIKLNNEILNDQEEIDFGEYPIEKIQSLQIFASSPRQLVLDGLQLAQTILPEMHKLITQILAYFENDQSDLAYQEFQVITDGLTWFSTIFHGIEEHFLDDLTQKSLIDHVFIVNGKKLSKIFEDLVNSQENSDETLFLDLVEYDLQECIGQLSENHQNFLDQLEL